MPCRRSKLRVMKTKTITMRYRDDLADKVNVLKMRPGGVSKFFEDSLDKLKVSDEEIKAMQLLSGK